MATDIPIHPDDHTDLDLLDTESDLLAQIDSPADLRKLAPEDLPRVADELREFLIESVSKTGGHLSAGLNC